MGALVQIDRDRLSPSILRQISAEITRGGIVLYPTETIYGLGCDAMNERAIERLFTIKMRPETKPVLVLVNDRTMLGNVVLDIPPFASALMKRFWPGPLTLLLNAAASVPPALTSGTGKIGVRKPGSEFCLRLLEATNTPIVSTSANISGRSIPADVASMKDVFMDKVDLFVDAGELAHSLPSTIVDVTENPIILVREGAIAWNEIKSFEKKTKARAAQ